MSDTTQQAAAPAVETPPVTTPPVAAPSDDVAALKAQLAALQAAEAERIAAAAKAAEEAAAKAEAERQSRLTAEQKRDEEIAAQRRELESTKQQLVQERRNLALDKLGVAEKFRQFAPTADPADPKGAKQLEEWAKANPELLRPQTTVATDFLSQLKQKAGTGLQQVLSGQKKSTLVTQRNLSKMG